METVLVMNGETKVNGSVGSRKYFLIGQKGNSLTIFTGFSDENSENGIELELETEKELGTVQEAVRAFADMVIEKLDAGFTEYFTIDDDEKEDDIEDEDEEYDGDSYDLVQSVDQIREQIAKFTKALNETSIKQNWIGRTLSSSKYWVYDSKTGNFGLNKVVGYYPLDPVDYTYGTVDTHGPQPDGGSAKKRIERVTGKSYEQSDEALKLFRKWVDDNLLPEAANNLNFATIKFLTI